MLEWLSELKDSVEQAFQAALKNEGEVVENTLQRQEQVSNETLYMNPKGVIAEPHILDTNQLNPVFSNALDGRKVARTAHETPTPDPVESKDIKWSTFGKRGQGSEIDIATVMQSCPSFAETARDLGGYVNNWEQLHRLAGQIRPMVGISEDAWAVAQQRLGPQMAAAALALIFDKFNAGEVASPGGYLRGMVEKAGAGELHLDRSFYGRLNEVRAA
jgi:replication initiation protein RepC